MDLIHSLDIAIQMQGYRPVPTEAVAHDGSVAAAGETIAAALGPVERDPNWQAIGVQLQLLSAVTGFRRAYLRRDRFDVDVVISYLWSGVLSRGTGEVTFDFTWDLVKRLYKLAGKFEIDEGTQQALGRVADNYLGPWKDREAELITTNLAKAKTLDSLYPLLLTNQPPYIAAGVAAIKLALDLASFKRGVTATVLLTGLGGVAADLSEIARREVGTPKLFKVDSLAFSVTPPQAAGVAIDGASLSVYAARRLGSFDHEQLQRNLAFLQSQ